MTATYKNNCATIWYKLQDSKPKHGLHVLIWGSYKTTGQSFGKACHFDEQLGFVGINAGLAEQVTHWAAFPEGPE